VDDWEGLPVVDHTWRAWKVAFRLAHLKHQRQIQASGGGEPLRGTNSVLPTPAVTIDRLGAALDNLALAAANDTTVLQQLTTANMALTTSKVSLTAANKKLSEALAKVPGAPAPGTPRLPRTVNKPKPGNYVGRMATVSANITPVQHAAPRQQGTWTWRRLPIRWEVATPTRDGSPHVAPDDAGGRI